MLMIFLICGVALAVVLAAVRIVLGWVHAPAGVWFGRAVQTVGDGFMKLMIVAGGAGILAFIAFAVFKS